MIGVDWIAGLPTTVSDFGTIRNYSTCCQERYIVPTVGTFACRPALAFPAFPDALVGSAYHKNTNAKVATGQWCHQRRAAWLRQRTQGRLG